MILPDLPRFGTGPGLHRMAELCRGLRPLDALKITGSNGKGSVAAMVSSILRAAGIDHGLYTSPHLFDFRERIRYRGEPIPEDELERSIAWFSERRRGYELKHPGDAIGAFEATTAIAHEYFSRVGAGVVVAEAGIGGRYDSTRIFGGAIAALVSLDFEHTQVLGRRLDEIALDKADLAEDVLVVGEIDADVRRRLFAYCRIRGVEIVDAEKASRCAFTENGMRAEFDDVGEAEIALWGEHQVANAGVAVALAREWLKRHRADVLADFARVVGEGLASVCWPGRFERIHTSPDVWVDVGHTPSAIAAAVRTARELFAGRRVVLVTGVSHDKDLRAILAPLVEIADHVVCTRAQERAAPAEAVESLVAELAPEKTRETADDIGTAMKRALELAHRTDDVVLVAGGLFLVIEACRSFEAVIGKKELDFSLSDLLP